MERKYQLMGKLKDLTGQRFNRLIVTGRAPNQYSLSGNRQIMWYCDCDCGTKNKIIAGSHLRSGATKSCGCLGSESTIKFNKKTKTKRNKYDLTGEYGIGWTTNTNEEFYFDLEDYDKIKDYCWYENDRGYIVTSRPNKKLHRIIMDITDSKIMIDHIFHNKKDNRKSQLRIVNSSKNQMNKSVQKNNKSGVPGVCWHFRDQVWVTYITQNGKRIYLGRYHDIEEAIKVRKKAEEKYFKEYSYENSTKLNVEESA